jgi:hypothetical protein
MKLINTLCGQSSVLSVKVGGKCGYHSVVQSPDI